MNILLLGHRDAASNVALSLIATALPEYRVHVRLSGPVPPGVETPPALRELAECEDRFVDDLAASGEASRAGLLGFEALAARGGGTFGELPRPNAPEGVEALAACEPDLVISVRYRRILRDAAIAVPRHGVLNLHSGLLPEYRGMMATFHAMLRGEPVIGSTLHYIVDAGIDTGPIVDRAPVTTDRRRSYLSNVLSLYPSGCAMVVAAVRCIERGEPPPRVAQSGEGAYYSAPQAADLARFAAAGLRLHDGTELQHFMQTFGGSLTTRLRSTRARTR